MAYQLENKKIVLGDGFQEDPSLLDSSIQIYSSNSMIVPAQLLFSKDLQIFLCTSGWCFMAIGLYYRLVVFKHLFKEYRKKELSPINVMIICSCMIQTVGVLFSQLYESLVVYNDGNLKDATGQDFCFIARLTIGFEILYSIIGGLGIALYRILLIKHNILVKYKIGETNLLYLILFSGLILVFGFVIAIIRADELSVIGSNCVLIPGTEFLEIIGEYQQSLGKLQTYSYLNQLRSYIAIALVSSTLLELAIYIHFFQLLYKNDNKDSLLIALGSKTIKARNKTNALTFFSQFCSFLFEISFILLMIFASLATSQKSHAYLLAIFLKKLSFAMMAVIEVLTSRNNLKATLF